MVTELSSGPFLAIEIGALNPNVSVHQSFRQLCGPTDPVNIIKFQLSFFLLDFHFNSIETKNHLIYLNFHLILGNWS